MERTATAEAEIDAPFCIPESTGAAFMVGFCFSIRIVLVLLSVTVLDTEPRTGAGVGLSLNFLLLLLACFHSLGYARRTLKSLLQLWTIRWVLIFLAVSCCSLVWSVTVSLPVSALYWCGMTADVAVVVLLLRAGSVSVVSNALMKGYIIGACCLALIAWIMPAQPDLRLGNEEFFNANQIGNLCAFAIFLAQYLMGRKEGRWGGAIAFLAVTLVRSLSKTTIAAFLLSEAFLLVRDKSMSRRTKVLLTIAVAFVLVVFWGLFSAYYDIYTAAGNQAQTLTGRTAIWTYALGVGLERPWIGHGFDSMWKVAPPFGPDRFEARHAENELLQQFYAYGLTGVMMLIGLYGSLFRQLRRLPKSPSRLLFLSMLLFIVIRGMAEAEPFDLLFPLWWMVLLSLLIEDLSFEKHDSADRVLDQNVIRL